MESVATTQLCPCNEKAPIDNREINGYDCVPIKLYLQQHVAGHSLMTHDLEDHIQSPQRSLFFLANYDIMW